MTNRDEIIYATWCLSDNFGDKLTPYLIEKISGKKCVFSPPESDIEKLVVAGSILNWDVKKATVWGAGVANKSDNVSMKNVLAVRGEISKYFAVLATDFNDIAVGDPALLLPRLFTPSTTKMYRVGIFPHYIDMDIVIYNWLNRLPSDILVINPLGDVEDIIIQMAQCEQIVSSSLHGLIVADAYGIPNRWVKISDRILGDGTKYMDYYSSIKQPITTKPADLMGAQNFVEAVQGIKCVKHPLDIDLEKLLACCPFKK